MKKNPLHQLQEFGQSVWSDFLSRDFIRAGHLKQLIDADGLSGVTSNPAIFAKAIEAGGAYEADIRRFQREGKTAVQAYEELAVSDIREAADLLRPVFDRTAGIDGYVSLEVSPKLAHDTQGTIQEVDRLWAAVNRPNVMIKIPATKAGLPAIEQCIADGVNINVTLLFGLPRYLEVAEAYIRGLERHHQANNQANRPMKDIRSVASFFLSRIDVLIDPKLEEIAQWESTTSQIARELRGSIAIASAKLAYQMYKEIFGSDRFKKLEQLGARKQWLLWGSTSTKTKGYSDVKYVEPLIGPETINTMPLETIDAYRDHGAPAVRIEEGVAEARDAMRKLAAAAINIDEMTQRLEDEAVEKFAKPFVHLLERLAQKTGGVPGGGADRRDEVGGSGVYPVSGPHPPGDAPIVSEPAWGQGQRGAEGYEESGGSEIWFRSGTPDQCRDIMTKNPACCLTSDTVETAARIMRDRDIGIVPVLEDRPDRTLAGVLTDRDIVIRVISPEISPEISQDRHPSKIRVEEIMSCNVITCSPEDDIRSCLDKMEGHQVRRIPIVDNSSRVVGIISQSDVAVRLAQSSNTAEVVREISKPSIGRAA
jgi:transaldolase